MTSRYGRNKRRVARERIAALEAETSQLSRRLALAERAVATAREDGATEILRARYLDQEIERMTHYLSKEYGPKLMEAANKLMSSNHEQRRKPLDFRAVFDASPESIRVTTIEGSIPALHYRMRLASF